METRDVEKLRRFALSAALVLITYMLAGIKVGPNASVTVLGLPFLIARSDLLPIGLVVACFAGMLRFAYYGLMLATSPYRRRRALIDDLLVHHDERIRKDGSIILGPFPSGETIWMYWGARKFKAQSSTSKRQEMEKRAAAFENAFPKFLWARAAAKVVGEPAVTEDGDEYTSYNIEVTVPIRCRIAAMFEDIDYSSPVRLNLIAVTSFIHHSYHMRHWLP